MYIHFHMTFIYIDEYRIIDTMAITIITNNKLLITENMTIIKIAILVEKDATDKACPRSINRCIDSRMSVRRRGGSCCGFVIVLR